MLSLRQVRYFIATAETGKVSAAAIALRISQSAVTLAIKKLEADLGIALFFRHANGVKLTKEGHQFLYHARNVEAAVADAIQSMRRNTLQITGDVTVGVSYTVSGYFLFPLLARFRRSYPTVNVRVEEGERHEIEKKIKRHKLDLGVILVSNLLDKKALKIKTLLRTPRRLWLSSAHPLLSRARITLDDLANEPYVVFTEDEVEQSTLGYWAKGGLSPNIVFRTSSLEAVRSMVATGAAVTILSDIVYRPWSLEGSRVEVRDIDFNIPKMVIGLVWERHGRQSTVGSLLKEFLIEAVK